MRCNQTSGQMDVPGSEQTPGAQSPPTVEILSAPATIYGLTGGQDTHCRSTAAALALAAVYGCILSTVIL